MSEVHLQEFKCWDCDQLFLLPQKSVAQQKPKFCPRCGSQAIQQGPPVTVEVKSEETP